MNTTLLIILLVLVVVAIALAVYIAKSKGDEKTWTTKAKGSKKEKTKSALSAAGRVALSAWWVAVLAVSAAVLLGVLYSFGVGEPTVREVRFEACDNMLLAELEDSQTDSAVVSVFARAPIGSQAEAKANKILANRSFELQDVAGELAEVKHKSFYKEEVTCTSNKNVDPWELLAQLECKGAITLALSPDEERFIKWYNPSCWPKPEGYKPWPFQVIVGTDTVTAWPSSFKEKYRCLSGGRYGKVHEGIKVRFPSVVVSPNKEDTVRTPPGVYQVRILRIPWKN